MSKSKPKIGSHRRKICFIITSHIHYARSKLILEEIRRNPKLELQIAVAASAILPLYGDVLTSMEHDGFTPNAKIIMTLAGGNPVAMAKTTGIGITEFATAFDNLKPDIVVVRGDRYEVLAAAIAASYMNIPVAHIEGGDTTGSIDESVRHAVTKLAHIHFVTNEFSRKRVLQMGEDASYIFDVGCPELEFVERHRKAITSKDINRYGVGDPLDLEKPFLMVMYHPVTTEEQNRKHTTLLLDVVSDLHMQTLWFWPNVDAGTDDVAKAIRVFREHCHPHHIRFAKYVLPEEFIALLKKCSCLIGNSSAGIKEASYLGIPVVNIGTRQNGRLRGPNVIDVGYAKGDIKKAIEGQLKKGRFKPSTIYYKEKCSRRIAETLARVPLYTQKSFRLLDHV